MQENLVIVNPNWLFHLVANLRLRKYQLFAAFHDYRMQQQHPQPASERKLKLDEFFGGGESETSEGHKTDETCNRKSTSNNILITSPSLVTPRPLVLLPVPSTSSSEDSPSRPGLLKQTRDEAKGRVTDTKNTLEETTEGWDLSFPSFLSAVSQLDIFDVWKVFPRIIVLNF